MKLGLWPCNLYLIELLFIKKAAQLNMTKINYTCELTHPATIFNVVKLKRQRSYAIHASNKLICIIELNDMEWKKYGSDLLTDEILKDLVNFLKSL